MADPDLELWYFRVWEVANMPVELGNVGYTPGQVPRYLAFAALLVVVMAAEVGMTGLLTCLLNEAFEVS